MKYLGQKLAPSADIYAMMARNKNSRCFHNRNRPVIFLLQPQIGYLPAYFSGFPKIDSIPFVPFKDLSDKSKLCHPQ